MCCDEATKDKKKISEKMEVSVSIEGYFETMDTSPRIIFKCKKNENAKKSPEFKLESKKEDSGI